MTGKTHMAISAAAVAVLLAAVETARPSASTGMLYRTAGHDMPSPPFPLATLGLLLLGIVAGLFPDLDAPDTELEHLPDRAAKHLGRYMVTGIARRSAPRRLAPYLVQLAALPLTLSIGLIGIAVRAFTAHRGFTHTLWGAVAFTIIAAGAALLLTGSTHSSGIVGVVWLLGYASHLAADACTPSGIPLLGAGRQARSSRRLPPPSELPRARSSGHHPRTRHGSTVHLLPRRMRIPTGSLADTLLVRWVSWAVFAAASLWTLGGVRLIPGLG